MKGEEGSLLEILIRENNALADERLHGEMIERLRQYNASEERIEEYIALRDQSLRDLWQARDDFKEYLSKLGFERRWI